MPFGVEVSDFLPLWRVLLNYSAAVWIEPEEK